MDNITFEKLKNIIYNKSSFLSTRIYKRLTFKYVLVSSRLMLSRLQFSGNDDKLSGRSNKLNSTSSCENQEY